MADLTPLEKFQKGWKTGDFGLFREGMKELEADGYKPEQIREEIEKVKGSYLLPFFICQISLFFVYKKLQVQCCSTSFFCRSIPYNLIIPYP